MPGEVGRHQLRKFRVSKRDDFISVLPETLKVGNHKSQLHKRLVYRLGFAEELCICFPQLFPALSASQVAEGEVGDLEGRSVDFLGKSDNEPVQQLQR